MCGVQDLNKVAQSPVTGDNYTIVLLQILKMLEEASFSKCSLNFSLPVVRHTPPRWCLAWAYLCLLHQ